jgi:hypothetical protein
LLFAAFGAWFFQLGYRARLLGVRASMRTVWVGVILIWAMILLNMTW